MPKCSACCKQHSSPKFKLCDRCRKQKATDIRLARALFRKSGVCMRCRKKVEPWRDSWLCAHCQPPGRQDGKGFCRRCGQGGHYAARCFLPPFDYRGPLPGGGRQYSTKLQKHQRADLEYEKRLLKARLALIDYQLANDRAVHQEF